MAELEQALDQILSDPGAMEEILALARRLGGGGNASSAPSDGGDPAGPKPAEPLSPGSGDREQGPAMLLNILSSAGGDDPDRTALLHALRPYLRKERQEKLDRAVRLAGLYQAARQAIRLWKEGDAHV